MKYLCIALISLVTSNYANATIIIGSSISLNSSSNINGEATLDNESIQQSTISPLSLNSSLSSSTSSSNVEFRNSLSATWVDENNGTVEISDTGWNVNGIEQFQFSTLGTSWTYEFFIEQDSILDVNWDLLFNPNNNSNTGLGFNLQVGVERLLVISDSFIFRTNTSTNDVTGLSTNTTNAQFDLVAGESYAFTVESTSGISGRNATRRSFFDTSIDWQITPILGQTTPVPEPSNLILMSLGFLLLAVRKQRQNML